MADVIETRLTCWVHYHILDLCDAGAEFGDEGAASASAGIVQAGEGVLHFVAAPHTGDVDMTVLVAPDDPGADDAFGDIVEISVLFRSAVPALVQWAGEETFELPSLPDGPGWYRARYHVESFDEAEEADVDAEEPVGRHLVQLWPAAQMPPSVVKATSAGARYWIGARPLR